MIEPVALEPHTCRRKIRDHIGGVHHVVDDGIVAPRYLRVLNAAHLSVNAVSVDVVPARLIQIDQPLCRQIGDPAAAGITLHPECGFSPFDRRAQFLFVFQEILQIVFDDLVRRRGDPGRFALRPQQEVGRPLGTIAPAAKNDRDDLFGSPSAFDRSLRDHAGDRVDRRLDLVGIADVNMLESDLFQHGDRLGVANRVIPPSRLLGRRVRERQRRRRHMRLILFWIDFKEPVRILEGKDRPADLVGPREDIVSTVNDGDLVQHLFGRCGGLGRRHGIGRRAGRILLAAGSQPDEGK